MFSGFPIPRGSCSPGELPGTILAMAKGIASIFQSSLARLRVQPIPFCWANQRCFVWLEKTRSDAVSACWF